MLKRRYIVAVVASIAVALLLFFFIEARLHGVTTILTDPVQDTIVDIINSPEDQSEEVYNKIQDGSLEDCYIIFYRADCSDCHDFYNRYKAGEVSGLNVNKPVYWVSSRTDYGMLVRENVVLDWAPTVFSYHDGVFTETDIS